VVAEVLPGSAGEIEVVMASGAYMGHARTFTVHWVDLAKCLPIDNDAACKGRRRELFDTFDPQGAGILYQARVVRGLFRLMPKVSGIVDMQVMIHQAYGVVRDIVDPVCSIGIDRMDRNQFRVFVIYLWYYIKLWDLFVQLGDDGKESRKVSLKQFEELCPWIQEWGIQDAAMWQKDPEACFEGMDRNRSGSVLFDDFAEWVLRRTVPQLSAAGEEDARNEAIRLLRRNHPELVAKPFPKKDRYHVGPCPPVCPPGQINPPMPMEPAGGVPKRDLHYRTQYKSDYLHPLLLPKETSASSSPARSRNLSRALTPRGPARAPSDLETGVALIRSSSMPDATLRTQGLDKQALRMKLENHLDMYSTGQMRKLLKVAGGMVVGPGSPTR